MSQTAPTRFGSRDDLELRQLQWIPLAYYLRETDEENGSVADTTREGAPSSITAVGMALATAPVVVERDILFAIEGSLPGFWVSPDRFGIDRRGRSSS